MHGKSFQERFCSKPENAAKAAAGSHNNVMTSVQGTSIAVPAPKGWQRICTIVPREWELRLQEAKRISTYRLAIELLYLHWYDKGKPITVSSKVAEAAKISVSSKWNALGELERLGLIGVNRKSRKAPRVVLHHTRTPQT